MTRGVRNDTTMKRWLAVARDDTIKGSHIFIVEAVTIKDAYEACTHQCVMYGLRIPEQRAVYELPEEIKEGGAHICTVLDLRDKGGIFNGRAELSIGPKSANAGSGSGTILR